MSEEPSPTLEAVQFENGVLSVLDQTRIPLDFHYDEVTTVEQTFRSIREMRVRGAPAIAMVAVLGLASDIHRQWLQEEPESPFLETPEAVVTYIAESLEYLGKSRPTAVNLFISIRELTKFVNDKRDEGLGVTELLRAYCTEAEKIVHQGVEECRLMSEFGSDWLMEHLCEGGDKIGVLTHCNAGALATAKHGTAVGVMKFLHQKNSLERAYCTETRPYDQGARLTAFEFVFEHIPVTLICDSVVSWLLKSGKVHCVVVGADRICSNGDTANKIGTYHIAVSCAHHKIPFFVAAPTTTIDLDLALGEDIPIEERSTEEVTHCRRTHRRVVVEGTEVWNPAFDVTPANLIRAIFTERGVISPSDDGTFDIKGFLDQ